MAKEGNTAFGLVVPVVSLAVAIVLMGCLRARRTTVSEKPQPTVLTS
ncbi:hypothetical protein [Streptomyces sp. Mo3]|nr:hypothetical protein OG546_35450 [Streptomyces antimycoticus]